MPSAFAGPATARPRAQAAEHIRSFFIEFLLKMIADSEHTTTPKRLVSPQLLLQKPRPDKLIWGIDALSRSSRDIFATWLLLLGNTLFS